MSQRGLTIMVLPALPPDDLVAKFHKAAPSLDSGPGWSKAAVAQQGPAGEAACFVAYVDDRPVGYVMGYEFKTRVPAVHLAEVYIEPEYQWPRGRIAELLRDAFWAWAASRGAVRVTTRLAPDKYRAAKKRFGFQFTQVWAEAPVRGENGGRLQPIRAAES